jgi:hypothetical protein
VDGNTAGLDGGGIYNGSGTFTMGGKARVEGNSTTLEGGGIYDNHGTLVGASAGVNVRSNTPDDIGP